MTYTVPETKSADGYYGEAYQHNMVQKYRNRETNHRKSRIKLAHRLVDEYALPRIGKKPEETTFLDVGCAIGTFPIEFAKRGLKAYGVDFSEAGIELARSLAKEEGVEAEFICGDVVELPDGFPPIDIMSCFDIFEHLHDDELGALLAALKPRLSEQGVLIFHTYPTQYDHVFYGHAVTWWPLAPLAWLPESWFTRLTKLYATLIDLIKIALKGKTQREIIKNEAHCNPLTAERLKDIFDRAGYDLLLFETSNLIPYRKGTERILGRQPVTFRDLQGAAIPRSRI